MNIRRISIGIRTLPLFRWLAPGFFTWLSIVGVVAREGTPPPSAVHLVQPLSAVAQMVLPATDVKAELAKDARKAEPGPLPFAVPRRVEASPATHGTWEPIPGGRLWRLRMVSAGATDLNLGFSQFWLPAGATLHVAAEDGSYAQGPYSSLDNKPHGQLWTPVLPGEAAVVELFVPAQSQEEPVLVLGQVGAGYRDFFHRKGDLAIPKIGSCNVDVACPQADPWRSEIRSVGCYTLNGIWTCTGTLMGNAAHDLRNFFLTANHCGVNTANASTLVVYWNYQSPACGMLSGGSLAQNQSGAIFRAARSDVDFALLELEDIPDASFNVHYAGWDRSGAAPSGCAGVHHPRVDEKCISFSSNALSTVNSCIGSGSATHWNVRWSVGVTEPGSSGSGIWDLVSHRYIGFLSGGESACATPTLSDCYGKFSVAWDGPSASTRLRDWLDPQNSGVTAIPGTDAYPRPAIQLTALTLAAEGCRPTNGVVDPGETVTVNLALRNVGNLSASNVVAVFQESGGVVAPSPAQDYGVLLAGGPSAVRPFTFTAAGVCGGTITATFRVQAGTNGLSTLVQGFQLGVRTQAVVFTQNFDAVSAPNLPSGWGVVPTLGWVTSTSSRDTLPNAAFAVEPSTASEKTLTSPSVAIPSTNAQLAFRHNHNTETGYDGGVLEISQQGGPFTDILTAGGVFTAGEYGGTLDASYGNPVGSRPAWTGSSAGWITTSVDLPPGAPGRTIQLRWRFGSDEGVGGSGWYVDTVAISTVQYNCCAPPVAPTIVELRRAPASISFAYDSLAGQSYRIQSSSNLLAAPWVNLQTNAGDGTRKFFTNAISGSARYFRLQTDRN